jgi:hypothetical protein
VTSVNGATGAVTVSMASTDFDGVGSYAVAMYASNAPSDPNSNWIARGATVAGSSLRVNSRSTGTSGQIFVNELMQTGTASSMVQTANVVFSSPNAVALSGTWRSMTGASWSRSFNTCAGVVSAWYPILWVRIA